jgi:hypothetical protein
VWRQAARLSGQLGQLTRTHDALGILQLLEDDGSNPPRSLQALNAALQDALQAAQDELHGDVHDEL